MIVYPIDENQAIGLIPARGGSKSIPLKNLTPIDGRPLISYVIEAARGASSLDAIYCSTDHPRIAQACRERDVRVIDRPGHLGEDDTPVTAVIRHALETLAAATGRMPGFVALLQPTSPFLLAEHIDRCVEALRARPDADSAQTIAPVAHAAHAFNQRIVEDGLVNFHFLEERRAAYNKQRKPKFFTFANLVVTRSRALLSGKDCFGDGSVPIEIPRSFAFDVDTEEDLILATFLARQGRSARP